MNTTAYDPKFAVLYFLAEKIVFSVERLFMKTTKPIESGFFKEHEHTGTKRLHQQRSVLRNVIGKVKNPVASGSLRTPDICCDAVQFAPLGQFHGASQQRRVLQFHVGIDKKHIRCLRAPRARITSY